MSRQRFVALTKEVANSVRVGKSRWPRLKAKGMKVTDIARELDWPSTPGPHCRQKADETRKPLEWTPAPGRLSADEREEIMIGLRASRCRPLPDDSGALLRR